MDIDGHAMSIVWKDWRLDGDYMRFLENGVGSAAA